MAQLYGLQEPSVIGFLPLPSSHAGSHAISLSATSDLLGQVVMDLETTFSNNASSWVNCFAPLGVRKSVFMLSVGRPMIFK